MKDRCDAEERVIIDFSRSFLSFEANSIPDFVEKFQDLGGLFQNFRIFKIQDILGDYFRYF